MFILPIKNSVYPILQGKGYIDIPEITTQAVAYQAKLDFDLETSLVGDSEMQHLDSLVHSFLEDESCF
ncbi:MAG: hypothetical protein NZM39_00335 [Bernardetiaceae bacterium]|nr:hypothetical protein [Bernardetiaceae bacterium]